MPLYGRSFANTEGLGAPYDGLGEGTIEAGIYSYEVLPLAGSEVFENTTDVTSYSYDAATKFFISYDTPAIIKMKSQYILDNELAGGMFWELSTDKVGADSLVGTAAAALGSLESSDNHIRYASLLASMFVLKLTSTFIATPTPSGTTSRTTWELLKLLG